MGPDSGLHLLIYLSICLLRRLAFTSILRYGRNPLTRPVAIIRPIHDKEFTYLTKNIIFTTCQIVQSNTFMSPLDIRKNFKPYPYLMRRRWSRFELMVLRGGDTALWTGSSCLELLRACCSTPLQADHPKHQRRCFTQATSAGKERQMDALQPWWQRVF